LQCKALIGLLLFFFFTQKENEQVKESIINMNDLFFWRRSEEGTSKTPAVNKHYPAQRTHIYCQEGQYFILTTGENTSLFSAHIIIFFFLFSFHLFVDGLL